MIKNGENREEEEKKKVGRNSDRKKNVDYPQMGNWILKAYSKIIECFTHSRECL